MQVLTEIFQKRVEVSIPFELNVLLGKKKEDRHNKISRFMRWADSRLEQ
jgi:hypothetical protein